MTFAIFPVSQGSQGCIKAVKVHFPGIAGFAGRHQTCDEKLRTPRFEVANFAVHEKTRRNTLVVQLQTVKI